MGDEVQLWKLMNKLVDRPSQLGSPDQLTNLIGAKVIESLPGEVLLLNLLDILLRHLPELSQRCHGLPHPLVHHLTQGETLVCQLTNTRLDIKIS